MSTKTKVLIVIIVAAILGGLAIYPSMKAKKIIMINDDIRRKADVKAILNATWRYAVDNDGKFPEAITATKQELSDTEANICPDIVPNYIANIPADPQTGSYQDCSEYSTMYHIYTDDTGNTIYVTATLSDGSTHVETR